MFDPYQTQGDLPDYDLKEFGDTAILTTDADFTPRVVIKEKEGHVKGASGNNGAYAQILQVQTIKKAMDIDLKAEIVPNAQGLAVGLANAYPGQAVTCAQFAANDDPAQSLVIHGFSRDAAKLLMVKEIKRTTSSEKAPMVTIPMSYYPQIALAA